jgi:hypothetical protein
MRHSVMSHDVFVVEQYESQASFSGKLLLRF